jgi:hypothetical protein
VGDLTVGQIVVTGLIVFAAGVLVAFAAVMVDARTERRRR